MAAKKHIDRLIDINDIDEEIKRIENSDDYYISENGNIYRKIKDDKYILLKPYISTYSGYVYQTINCQGNKKSYRVHRLVAQYFVDNPNNFNVVMHIDNDKTNNVYTNLKWGTVSENTKQAFDDGLIVNASGYDDSQSYPVCVYNLNDELLYEFGSITIASKELNISKSTISKQCKGITKNKPRCGYKFRYKIN